jgi:cation diffusion facilitator family transporter
MRWIRVYEPDNEINKEFRKALLVTFLGNLILAGIKIAAAVSSRSTAIYSDAINSISDVLYSVFLIIGLLLSQRPPDISHPQGHSRFEPFAALIVAISMTLAGVEAMRMSIVRTIEGGAAVPLGIPLIAIILSMAIKTGMYVLVHQVSRKIASPGLDAAAKDNLSDVITSLAALLGILGSNYLNPVLDPLAGVLVALWIFRAVYQTVKENLGYLTGAGADEQLRNDLMESARSIHGVEDVHRVITEYAGPRLIVEMHINVDGSISLNEAHRICDQVTEQLEALPQVDRAYVHVEPTRPEKA